MQMDNTTGNMVNLPCDGTGWWQVDLGGVYNLAKVVFFNRYPIGGSALGAAASGAQLVYLNGLGINVGTYTLTGDAIQSINVQLRPPTPSFTPTASTTPSASGTGSQSQTPASTPDGTPLATATLSPGSSASNTAAATPSVTGSSSASTTAASTVLPPASPLSSLPVTVSVATTGGGAAGCLQFFEVFVFSPTFQLLSARASTSMTTTSQSLFSKFGAKNGNNLLADLTGETGLVLSGCSAQGDKWTVAWPAPTAVGIVYFVNRAAPNNLAIVTGNGTVTITSQAGLPVAQALLTSATVTTVSTGIYGSAGVVATLWDTYGNAGPASVLNTPGFVSPAIAPIFPNPNDPWQQSFAAQSLAVRYVSLIGPLFLNFREIFIFDNNMVNVAYLKNATSTQMFTNDPVAYTASMGNDGIIDFDVNYGNMVYCGPYLAPTWTVDLGGMYNITSFVFFNRVSNGLGGGYAANAAGVTVNFLNAFGAIVGQNTLVGNLIETQTVTLFAPSPSASNTATAASTTSPTRSTTLSSTFTPSNPATASITGSNTGSPSNTPSNTGSASASISVGGSPSGSVSHTSSPSATATDTDTASASPTPSTSATHTGTPSGTPSNSNPVRVRIQGPINGGICLNFMELMVFDVDNRLVSALQTGASTVASTTYCANAGTANFFCNYAFYGNDMLADTYTLDTPNQRFFNANCQAGNSDYWQVTFAYAPPGSPFYPNPIPAAISNVYFVNRDYNGFNTRIVPAAGAAMVQLIQTNGSIVAQQPLTTATVTTLTFNTPSPAPTPNPLSIVQQDPYAKLVSTRFLRINAAPGNCLMFREVMVFDTTYTNVALMKPTSSSTQASGYTSSMGVNGVITYDAYTGATASGDLVSSSACDGTAWWQVDLGGIYNISAIMVWNAEPLALCPENNGYTTPGNMCASAQQLAGATLQLINYYGDGVINSTTLAGMGVQTIFSPFTYVPTPSVTPTTTASTTSTQTPTTTTTSTSSPSQTASSSASISSGATPTQTSTQTGSSSVTASASATHTVTPTHTASQTASPTPPSIQPITARITTSGTGQCLNFVEVFVFDINNRNVAAAAYGGTTFMTSTYGTNYAQFGNDLIADSYLVTNNGGNSFVNAGCASTLDYWQVTWPTPTLISEVYFVNRVNQLTRIATGNGVLTLMNQFGTVTNTFNMAAAYPTGASVESFNVSVPLPIQPPDASLAVQQDATARLMSVRYLRINASAVTGANPAPCLTFREIFAFDGTQVNVARGQRTTSSALSVGSTAAMGVDGIIDFDNVTPGSNLVSGAGCDGSDWWMVDLGGLYNLTSIVVWNYYPITSNPVVGQGYAKKLAGATLQALNWNGDVINTTVLNGGAVQTIKLATYAPTPSNTPSNSPSPSITPTPTSTVSISQSQTSSGTPSNSVTASASLSFGSTPSATASVTPSNSATSTATVSPFSSNPVTAVLSTSGTGQCLEFAELFIFDVNGRNVGAVAAGAQTALSSLSLAGLANGPSFGGDLQADPFAQYSAPVIAGCALTADSYTVTFPPTAEFPGGYPIPIALAYFVNVVTGPQVANANGKLSLYNPGGVLVAQDFIRSTGTVSTLPFGSTPVVPTPNPSLPVQLDPAARNSYPRFVRIAAAPGQCLYFRE